MTATIEQIDRWRALPKETQHLEFKEAKAQYDQQKLLAYCVGIANEGGGHLLLGIANDPPRPVVGTQAFLSPISTAESLFHSLRFRVDVEQVDHPDGRVLVFHIPSRPQGTAYNLDGRYLMRSGEELVAMTEDQLRKIFSEGRPDFLEELSMSGLSGQDVVQLLDTQAYFELRRYAYPSEREGVLERLIQDRIVVRSPTERFPLFV